MLSSFQKYDSYKESKTAWLGDVPNHWSVVRLGGEFSERRTKVSDEDYAPLSVTKNGIVPRLESAAKSNDGDNRKLVKVGDFVINSRSDRKGSSGVSPTDGSVSLINTVLEPRTINPKFSEYLLKSHAFIEEFYRMGHGIVADLWTTRYDEMSIISIVLPEQEEQTAIANFLDDKTEKIDRAIAIKEAQIARLDERKQILIQTAVTRGLDPNVPMKDSGVDWIGEIPAHWEVKKLKFIADSQGRIGFKGYSTTDLVDKNEGALVFGASHMSWTGKLKLEKPVFISWVKYYESPEIMVSEGDVLIVQRGSTCGKVALVSKNYGHATINPSLVLLKNIKIDSHYFFLGTKVVLPTLLYQVSNTAIPMLSQFQIDNIKIFVPPPEEQVSIVENVVSHTKSIDRLISDQNEQIQNLKEYRASLINSAVTGKIKVTS